MDFVKCFDSKDVKVDVYIEAKCKQDLFIFKMIVKMLEFNAIINFSCYQIILI